MHPTDSELLALVHHESGAGRRVTQTHLAACAECQTRYRALAQQDGEIASLFTLLDTSAPVVSLAGITRRGRLGRRRRSVAAAAAAILIAATAAATVIPGTPFHRYFHRVAGHPAILQQPVPSDAPALADTAGVTVAADTDVMIALRNFQRAGEIHLVWLQGAPAVSVRAIGGDVGYTVRSGRVVVENRRPALRYEITLPPAIPSVTLMMADQVVWQSPRQDARSLPTTIDLTRLDRKR